MAKSMEHEDSLGMYEIGHMRLDGTLQARLVHPLRKDHAHGSIALQQPKYRDFSTGPTSSLALTHTTEIRLVNLDLASQQPQCLLTGQRVWPQVPRLRPVAGRER